MTITQTTDRPAVIRHDARRGAPTLAHSSRRPRLTVNEDYDLLGKEAVLDDTFDAKGVRLTQNALGKFEAAHHCGRDVAAKELVGLMELAASDLEHRHREISRGYHSLFFRGASVVLSPDLSAAVSYRTRHRHLPSTLAGQDPSSYLSIDETRALDPQQVLVLGAARQKYAEAAKAHMDDPALEIPLRELLAASWAEGSWGGATDKEGNPVDDRYRCDYANCTWFVSALDGGVIGFRVRGELPESRRGGLLRRLFGRRR